jgi:putative ABC transport system substrate-binding protein
MALVRVPRVVASPLLCLGVLAASVLTEGFQRSENVEAGGRMSCGPELTEQSRQAAGYVGRILRGAKPPDLPVEQPTHFELIGNLKVAKALGVTIPPSVLARVDHVIE